MTINHALTSAFVFIKCLLQKTDIEELFDQWMTNAKEVKISYVNNVIATFERHKQGIVNAFKTQTDSGKHENLNGRIQSVLAKAEGF